MGSSERHGWTSHSVSKQSQASKELQRRSANSWLHLLLSELPSFLFCFSYSKQAATQMPDVHRCSGIGSVYLIGSTTCSAAKEKMISRSIIPNLVIKGFTKGICKNISFWTSVLKKNLNNAFQFFPSFLIHWILLSPASWKRWYK